MHVKHIPLLYAISTPFAVYKYKMHLFSVLANEPTESRLIFWLHVGPKNQLCPELLGGMLHSLSAAHCSSRHCRSCHPNSAALLSMCQTIKWFAYMQLHISSLYFSLTFSAWCKLNESFLPQHCGFMSTSDIFLHPWDGCHWLTMILRVTHSTLLILFSFGSLILCIHAPLMKSRIPFFKIPWSCVEYFSWSLCLWEGIRTTWQTSTATALTEVQIELQLIWSSLSSFPADGCNSDTPSCMVYCGKSR